MCAARVRPFEPDDAVAAGHLLAERHRAQRRQQPFLAAAFEDASRAADEVAGLAATEGASGAVAEDGGRLTGFLLGIRRGDEWGPNVWVEAAGHACADPEVVRDLYRAAAAIWVGEGRTAHYVLVPATDPGLVDAWFRLCFGNQHTHAARGAAEAHARRDGRVTIRRAAPDDVEALVGFDVVLSEHLAAPPVFARGHVIDRDEAAREWREALDDDDVVFVAEAGGTVVGSALGCSIGKSRAHSGLARPDNAALFAFAAVQPESRGGGIGRALGAAVVEALLDAGATTIVSDWRTTNLTASRAWPALGFAPTFLRMHRLVGY